MYQISVDTGGTFTDVVVATDDGRVLMSKALTTNERAFDAIAEALEDISGSIGVSTAELIRDSSQLNYGTTRSTNLVVTRNTARTALLTTKGFPDVLLLREGGKPDPFKKMDYGQPYVPRYLTFEVDERMTSTGVVHRPLDEDSVLEALDQCAHAGVEAIAVSLLWSVANPAHERRTAELIESRLPGVPWTLSHEVNPSVREYRRASSAAIDASLKPSMSQFFVDLDDDLREAGFLGSLLISTAYGGGWDAKRISQQPIYSIGSGPSMAPVAAIHEAELESERLLEETTLLVTDMGGTTFDLSLVQGGRVAQTSETWLRGKWVGDITGTRSVDIESIGAGGGSIVWIDAGGLLKVGPQSAGSAPGPACYGRGGTQPTITDAALLLGYLDSSNFVGGRLELRTDLAEEAFRPIADALGRTVEEAAYGAMLISVDNIVTAIREKTVTNGIDLREVTLVAGGGASGLNVGHIARSLGLTDVVVPKTAGAMSAYGALHSPAKSEFETVAFSSTRDEGFAIDAHIVSSLLADSDTFFEGLHPATRKAADQTTEFYAMARYPMQAWELMIELGSENAVSELTASAIEEIFHREHERVFGVREEDSAIEILALGARAISAKPKGDGSRRFPAGGECSDGTRSSKMAYFAGEGWLDVPVYLPQDVTTQRSVPGPAIVLEPTTTIVVYPGQALRCSDSSNYQLTL